MVTAKDGAPEPRLGTASVTVQVLDVPDEVPTFQKSTDRISVPENVPDFLVTKVTVSVIIITPFKTAVMGKNVKLNKSN